MSRTSWICNIQNQMADPKTSTERLSAAFSRMFLLIVLAHCSSLTQEKPIQRPDAATVNHIVMEAIAIRRSVQGLIEA